MLVELELEVLESLPPKSALADFSKSIVKWELLLLVAKLNGNTEYGIWNYIDSLKTRTENSMTIYTFIKSRIENGSFVVVPGEKKSRKTLALSPQLREELMTYLAARTEHTLQRSEQLRSELMAMSA
ncbi:MULTISPECIES: hypothetical protein [Nereida]|jgi:hypothetical protein|uniref:Uncharacterized protein n=1 Tax=Nereida ignava TaxID=282199 RepID=A0A0U1NLX9_9RHOB|nr:hypothetical protein [Nereida ignava]CRK75708.1 hypothetical protein NIG5292_01762 [Nereida ignava]SFJ32369.1 hypothetical protein SAMN02745667_00968 [Nereida ignava DSM 16309]